MMSDITVDWAQTKIYREIIHDLSSRVGFIFDRSVGRYRDLATGRFVSEKSLEVLMNSYADDFLAYNIDKITSDFLDGKITLTVWQERMARELKDAYVVTGSVGRGGRYLMDYSDYGRIGGHLRAEYRYLNQFAQEIKLGTLSSAQIRWRAHLYARGAQMSYWEGRRKAFQDAGKSLERRVLHPAEHCEDCIQYAAQGWQSIGTFPPPGLGSRCMHGCRCSMEWK